MLEKVVIGIMAAIVGWGTVGYAVAYYRGVEFGCRIATHRVLAVTADNGRDVVADMSLLGMPEAEFCNEVVGAAIRSEAHKQ